MSAPERLLVRGARIIDPANGVDAVGDLALAEGRIVGVGRAPDGFAPDRVLEAEGLVACPGLVDLAARLREPGFEHKATVASETRAAAAGGITTLCCPPDTDPVIDTPAVAELVRRLAEAAGHARVVCLGALTRGLDGERLSEMAALAEAGCVGVGNALRPVPSTLVLRRAMEYAATFGLTVHIHPLDGWLRDGGCAHEGQVATRLGLPGIPEAAETAEVARCLALVEQTGVRVHFGRLSTARAVRMIARAQYDGVPVTADVAATHLHLTEADLAGFNAEAHLEPPLRTERDREGLRDGLARGVIGAVCSDHQPHEPDAKLAPFPSTEPGASGLETLLPLTLRLVDEGVLTLPQAIERLTAGPAAILGIEAGTLSPGARADVCVFDPEARWRLDPARMVSAGRNSPFAGWPMKGRVRWTVLEGRIVWKAAP